MRNAFKELAAQEEEVGISAVEGQGWRRMGGATLMLAAASKVVEAGRRAVLDPLPGGSYFENTATGEKLGLRKDRGVYAIDARYESGGDGGHHS